METAKKNHVLLIEDDPGDARLVAEVLKQAGSGRFTLETAKTLADGLAKLSESSFDVVLLDLSLPDSFGVSTVDRVLELAPEQPIIVLTGAKDEQLALEAGQKGAQDYLVKSEMPGGVLTRSIVYAIERKKAELELRTVVETLRQANQKIIEQQKMVIEEERLKVLLQMTGSTADELNQPLMSLLGNIELIRMIENNPRQILQRLENIEVAGRRIADVVKKMHALKSVNAEPLISGTQILNGDKPLSVLAVEDSKIDFLMMQHLFKNHDHVRVTQAESVSAGIKLLKQAETDIILLDYQLEDGNGVDFLKMMKSFGIDKPVIAITGQCDEKVATRMLKAGADDYLPKSDLNQALVLQSMAMVLEKHRQKTEISLATKKLAQMAINDCLTGLYNRRHMNLVLNQEFGRAQRYGTDLSLLLLDLDNFKQVNDHLGHAFGDFVLQQAGKRLLVNVRGSDVCFRYGGEEFLILLPQTDAQGAEKAAEKIRRLFEDNPFNNDEYEKAVTVSIGVTSFKDSTPDRPEDLIAFADKALYLAKAEGRNCVRTLLMDSHTAPNNRITGFKSNAQNNPQSANVIEMNSRKS